MTEVVRNNPFFCIANEEVKAGRKDSLEDGAGQGWAA